APGIKIDEGRTKRKHDKASEQDDSSTESDDVPLAQKLKQKTSEEAQIPGLDIPLTTVLPETQPINLSSSTSADTAD
ncbi:hypothetical protein A2U01_0072109, partial [Trifolium medium]|nr:hypothetical protein [Trifolium medium]